MIMDNELKLEDVCKFKNIEKLKGETKEKMLKASARLQGNLDKAFNESLNGNLCKVSRLLQVEGFTASEAIDVIYSIDGHREPVGNEIERAVDLIFSSKSDPTAKRSEWPVFETPLEEVKANIKQRNIEPLSEAEIVAKLGDATEVDNVSDFLSEFFKGISQPIYIGNRYHGIIEHTSNWLMMPEVIEDDRYDQMLANPMKRKLTADERVETVTDASGKVKLKYPSGGRGLEFASDTLDVITFEADKISPELQLGVIRYLARHLPLVSLLFSAGKSYHATFSTKGVDDIHVLRKQLVDLGGDGAVMSPAQLTRLGAVNRSDNGNGCQKVLWINGDARNESVDQDKLADLLPEVINDCDSIKAFHYNGKIYVLDGTGKRFIAITQTDFARDLRALGYSNQGSNGQMSAVDVIKHAVIKHKTVDAVGPLAGRSIGLREDDVTGMRHLVTRKNTRIIGKEGNWDQLRKILVAQYGEDQLVYLFSWLHRSRYQLEKEEYMQGHALAISGAVNGGKSLIITKVIQPLLGQVADPYRYLCKGNDFNADLVGSEMLLIDDKKLSRKMEDRQAFGSQIKSIVAASGNVSCHGKGVDAYNVSPLWRIVIAINDTEQDLGAFPPLGEGDEDTIGDKVLLLKCFQSELPFTGDRDQFAKIGGLIKSNLEAFAYFIDNYKIPDAIQKNKTDNRFGFNRFHHPDLLAVLNQNSNDRTLLSATDWVLFEDEYSTLAIACATTGRRYWEGKAKEWSNILLSNKDIPHRVKSTIEGELAFGDSAQKAGHKMKTMAEVSDGRVEKKKIKGQQIWRIWEPLDVDFDDENEPF